MRRAGRRRPASSAPDDHNGRSAPRLRAEDAQGDRPRCTAAAAALDGDGHIHSLMTSGDRLAERRGRLPFWAEQPLIGDRPGRAIGSDPTGHVNPAPSPRLLLEGHAGHVERRMMELQVQDDAADREQDHGERRAEQLAQPTRMPGRMPGRRGRAATAPEPACGRIGLANRSRGRNPGTVPQHFRPRVDDDFRRHSGRLISGRPMARHGWISRPGQRDRISTPGGLHGIVVTWADRNRRTRPRPYPHTVHPPSRKSLRLW